MATDEDFLELLKIAQSLHWENAVYRTLLERASPPQWRENFLALSLDAAAREVHDQQVFGPAVQKAEQLVDQKRVAEVLRILQRKD